MKKSTKGALAAGGAAVLLLGGAGSLAYWTDSSTAQGGSITSGELALGNGECDTDWVYAPGSAGAGQVVTQFVPGDEVTKDCTFSVEAEGQNLEATVSSPDEVTYTTSRPGTSFSLTNAVTYDLTDGQGSRAILDGDTITEDDDDATLTATFVVTVPFGTDEGAQTKINANDTQALTATLDTLTVSVSQVDPN